MIRTLALRCLATALLAAAALPAWAMPSLRSEVTVNAAIVTVGDMFEDAGRLAELALFRAPQPGTTGVVDLRAIRAAANRIGLAEFENIGIISVPVTRASVTIDTPALGRMIEETLGARGLVPAGAAVELSFDRPDLAFQAEIGDTPARLLSLRYLPGSTSFLARFQIAGTDMPVDVTGNLDLMIEAPHLAGPRAAGTVLTADDIVMKKVPLRYADNTGIVSLDQLLGQQLERPGRANLMLRVGDVVAPQVVARNQMVTVVLRSGPMTLTVKGQALNAASQGQPVQVLNTATRKILSGVALSDGAVEITNTLNVAGL